jgi:hypothetical protein
MACSSIGEILNCRPASSQQSACAPAALPASSAASRCFFRRAMRCSSEPPAASLRAAHCSVIGDLK